VSTTFETSEVYSDIKEFGIVSSSIDGVARLTGFDDTFIGEVIDFKIVSGVVLNLENLIVGAAILGSEDSIKMGDMGERGFIEVLLPVGIGVLGSVLDPIGRIHRQY
jgi:F-type H+-transporting ATPase subunit alpha